MWIRQPPMDPGLRAKIVMPPEYGQIREVPESVQRDSIVASLGHLPEAMVGFFGGFASLLSPDLPLTRREHELIAVVVSAINECFY